MAGFKQSVSCELAHRIPENTQLSWAGMSQFQHTAGINDTCCPWGSPFLLQRGNLKSREEKTWLKITQPSIQQRPGPCLKAGFLCEDLQMLSEGKHQEAHLKFLTRKGLLRAVSSVAKASGKDPSRFTNSLLARSLTSQRDFHHLHFAWQMLCYELLAFHTPPHPARIQVASSSPMDLKKRAKDLTVCKCNFHISRSKIYGQS